MTKATQGHLRVGEGQKLGWTNVQVVMPMRSPNVACGNRVDDMRVVEEGPAKKMGGQ